MALELLRPVSARVKRLGIWSSSYREFLPWLLTKIQAPTTQSFALVGGDYPILPHSEASYPALSDPKYEACLLSIRSLYLTRASFDWGNPAYRDLVSLTLCEVTSGERMSPTVGDILSILSESPQLHTLRLITTLWPSDNDQTLPSRVHLGVLKNLDLRQAGTLGLIQLLPRLYITSRKLSFTFASDIEEDPTGRCMAALKEFWARVNITRLLLEGSNHFDSKLTPVDREERIMITILREFCSVIPNLPSLTLVGRRTSNLLKIITRATSRNEWEPCFPMLQVFYAINWALGKEDIENFDRVHPLLKKMRLIGCKFPANSEFEEWLGHEIKYAKVLDTKWHRHRTSRDYADPL